MAGILNHLAGLYADQNGHTEVEPLYRRALAIFETARGPDHPDVAATLEEYAGLLRATGREAQAAEIEARARAKHARIAAG